MWVFVTGEVHSACHLKNVTFQPFNLYLEFDTSIQTSNLDDRSVINPYKIVKCKVFAELFAYNEIEA